MAATIAEESRGLNRRWIESRLTLAKHLTHSWGALYPTSGTMILELSW
jgi:hypothetical protein